MPDLYAVTASKLYAVSHRIVGDRLGAKDVLSTVYLKIWSERNTRSDYRTLDGLIALTRRCALDHKHSGEPIPRVQTRRDTTVDGCLDPSTLSDADLDILGQILSHSTDENRNPAETGLARDAVLDRLITIATERGRS